MIRLLFLLFLFVSLTIHATSNRNIIFLKDHGFNITREGEIISCPANTDLADCDLDEVADLVIAFYELCSQKVLIILTRMETALLSKPLQTRFIFFQPMRKSKIL